MPYFAPQPEAETFQIIAERSTDRKSVGAAIGATARAGLAVRQRAGGDRIDVNAGQPDREAGLVGL
jgi:hypothetical protein